MDGVLVGEGSPIYKGNGIHESYAGILRIQRTDKTIQKKLSWLENPETARRYLNQYGFLAKVVGKFGQLDLYIQERYNLAKTTLKTHKKELSLRV